MRIFAPVLQYRRAAAWAAFMLLLGAVGWVLHVMLPPEPRCALRGWFPYSQLSPDGSRLVQWQWLKRAAPEEGGSITLFDTRTGEVLDVFFRTNGVAEHHWVWSPDCRYLAGASRDLDVLIVDVASGEERRVKGGAHSPRPTFSPDGEYLAFGAWPVGVRLVQTRTGRIVQSWPTAEPFHDFSPQSDFLVFSAASDRKDDDPDLRIWDLRQGVPAGNIPRAGFLAFGCDGKTLYAQQKVASGLYGSVVVWDLPGGREHGRIGSIAGDILSLTLSAEDRIAVLQAITRGTETRPRVTRIEVWDLAAAKRLASCEDKLEQYEAVVVSPDGASFAVHDRQNLTVFDSSTAQPRWHTARTPTRAVLCGAFGFAGLGGPRYLARFTPDSRSLIMETAEDLQWRDAVSGELRVSWCQSDFPASAASPGDRVLACESGMFHRDIGWLKEQVHRWLPVARQRDRDDVVRVLDARSGRRLCEVYEPVSFAMLSDDGSTLATFHHEEADGGGPLHCWDVPARKPWRWVLGVPLGLGVSMLMLRSGWRRLRRRPPTAPDGTHREA